MIHSRSTVRRVADITANQFDICSNGTHLGVAESREFNGSIGEGESDEEVTFSFNAEEVIRPLPRKASCKGVNRC